MTKASVRVLALAAALVLSAASRAAAQEPADSVKQRTPAAATGAARESETSARPARPTRSNRTVITREEIEASQASDAFVLVQRLRPQWLRGRGTYSASHSNEVRVYRDGAPFGSVASLRQVPLSQVRSLRYYDAIGATQRFGADNEGGAIEIVTEAQ